MDETIISLFQGPELCRAMGARQVHPQSLRFKAVSTDSRKVGPEDLFFALSGERFDAHDFIADVIGRGCRGVVISRDLDLPEDVTAFVVPDVLRAFGALASAILDKRRALGNFTTFAVTGSNGKTTTKELLTRCLESLGHNVLKTEGNFNNFVGMPMTAARLTTAHDTAVLEMGANAPGEIRYLSSLGKPDVAIITCVGAAHLEGFGSLEGVAAAKGEMIDAPGLKTIILPTETRRFYAHKIPDGVEAIWVGDCASGEAFRFEDVRATLDGITFKFHSPERELSLSLPLLGTHNAGNLAKAVAAMIASHPGKALDETSLNRSLSEIRLPSGRLERWVGLDRVSFLHDAYNANPSSMGMALDLMSQFDTPKCLILGEMRELGPESPELHRQIGQKAGALGPKRLLCVGEHASCFAQGARDAGMSEADILTASSDDLDTALEKLRPALLPDTVCLIKGSRGVRLERVLDHFGAHRV